MNGAHEALDDTVFVVNDLGKGSEAVSGARSIGNLYAISMSEVERDRGDKCVRRQG